MNTNYKILTHDLLASRTSITKSQNTETASMTFEDKAELIVSDFTYIRPFSVSPTTTITQINSKMIACGVRMLFVTDAKGILHGLVTYTDLFGEKPVRYIQEHGGTREEILAQDIMTPLTQLEALRKSDVLKAKVGDIVETVKAAGRQHMLVSLTHENGDQVITGMVSSTHLENVLGIKIELSPRAHTFADLERALT